MAMKFRIKRKISIGGVVSKLTITLISLWVGGVILDALGDVMVYSASSTCSPFFGGLNLLGWTVNSTGCITATNTSTGVLIVVGLVGVASIVLEFVQFKL